MLGLAAGGAVIVLIGCMAISIGWILGAHIQLLAVSRGDADREVGEELMHLGRVAQHALTRGVVLDAQRDKRLEDRRDGVVEQPLRELQLAAGYGPLSREPIPRPLDTVARTS